MKPARLCKDRFEDVVALVMGELALSRCTGVAEHIAACNTCRAAYDILAEEEKEVRSGFEALRAASGRSNDRCLKYKSTGQESV